MEARGWHQVFPHCPPYLWIKFSHQRGRQTEQPAPGSSCFLPTVWTDYKLRVHRILTWVLGVLCPGPHSYIASLLLTNVVSVYKTCIWVCMMHACACAWWMYVSVCGACMWMCLVHACECIWCMYMSVFSAYMWVHLVHACECVWCMHVSCMVNACECVWYMHVSVLGACMWVCRYAYAHAEVRGNSWMSSSILSVLLVWNNLSLTRQWPTRELPASSCLYLPRLVVQHTNLSLALFQCWAFELSPLHSPMVVTLTCTSHPVRKRGAGTSVCNSPLTILPSVLTPVRDRTFKGLHVTSYTAGCQGLDGLSHWWPTEGESTPLGHMLFSQSLSDILYPRGSISELGLSNAWIGMSWTLTHPQPAIPTSFQSSKRQWR